MHVYRFRRLFHVYLFRRLFHVYLFLAFISCAPFFDVFFDVMSDDEFLSAFEYAAGGG